MPVPDDCVQINVALVRLDGAGQEHAQHVLARVAQSVEAWRSAGLCAGFWFLRKSPDLRLRFITRPDTMVALRDRVAALMTQVSAAGFVDAWHGSWYEPETRKLGGEALLAPVHRYFAADSRLWSALAPLRAAGAARLEPKTVSALVLNDLFAVATGDADEAWDVWCNLGALYGVDEAALIEDGASPPAACRRAPRCCAIRDVATRLLPDEQSILRRYRDANAALAAAFARAEASGRLAYGRRSVLPFIATFHLNRHGHDLEAIRAVCRSMMVALDIRAGLRRHPGHSSAGWSASAAARAIP